MALYRYRGPWALRLVLQGQRDLTVDSEQEGSMKEWLPIAL